MKLTLHVGLPKTATTTIQHVLEAVKPQLTARGVLYPGTTASQLELVRRTQFDRVGASTAAGSVGEAVERLASEIRAVRPDHVVLSCEHMSLVPARAVARLKQVLEDRLPEVREVAVLCYVREPIGFATSLCQQRLKSGTVRLSGFAADPWPFSLRQLLGKQVDCYGQAAVRLRYLHHDHLVNGSAVDDVLAELGVAGIDAPVPVPVLNRSLSQEGAQVADALAGLVPRDRRSNGRNPVYKRMLEAIRGNRFVLPSEVQAKIIAASQADFEHIRKVWGLEIVPEPVELEAVPGLDAEAALAMARQIVAEADRLLAARAGDTG